MQRKLKKPTCNQAEMIRRRSLDPKDYLVIKDTPARLYLYDRRFATIKVIYKHT